MTTHRNMMMRALMVAVVVIGNAAYLRSEPDVKAKKSKSHAVQAEPTLGNNLPVDELNASHDGTNLAQDERGLTANRRIHSWPPFHVVTNALEIMTDLVEARCVLLVDEYRRQSYASRVDWDMIIASAELRRSILTEELRSMLYPIPFGASWDDAADVMVGLLNGTRRNACANTRGISGTVTAGQQLPYSEIVPIWMSVQERQLFLVAQARMQSILTDVFADIALEFESAGDAKTSGPASSFLSFTRRD